MSTTLSDTTSRQLTVPRTPRPTAGIFGTPDDLWTIYRVQLAFREKLIGGIPKDPKLIESWLRSRAGIDDPQDLRLAALRTLDEVGDGSLAIGTEDGLALGTQKRTTGFKVAADGLYVEGRQVKAMLKESTNIVFAGERWGPTRKAPRAFFAERVFVEPDRIMLGVQEPTGVELVVGHLTGPLGPRSTLTNYEYVERATIECRVLVLRDCISGDQWRAIWSHAQENGFGTLRSQGHGRFDVVRWENFTPPPG